MEKIAYIIDSSCFLNEEEATSKGLFFLPIHIVIEGEDFLEGKTLDKEYLLQAIQEKKNITTSQPSPGEVIELINNLKKQGYTCGIFAAMGSGLSKTLESAIAIAATEGFKIYPIDSKAVGNVQTLPLLKARKLIEEDNYSIEDAIACVNEDITHAFTVLLPDDLFHLSRGGRITNTAAALGSMLKIKPILTLVIENDGKIDVIEKVRTTKKAYRRMAELVLEQGNMADYEIIMAHFAGLEAMQELKEELLHLNNKLDVKEFELTTAIGVHTGLNSVGIQITKK